MSVWDEPELQAGGEYVAFEKVGDSIAGTITAVRVQRFAGPPPSVAPQILLVTDDGEERTVTAGQVKLKAELATLRPEAGDHIAIKLVQEEKRAGGKTLKHWDVQVQRANGNGNGQPAQQPQAPTMVYTTTPQQQPTTVPTAVVPSPQHPTASTVDPAAIAAALGSLTPEQRVAMGLPPY